MTFHILHSTPQAASVLNAHRISVYIYRMKNAQIREAFFRRMAPTDQILRMLDFLPEVSFFIKDRKGRFMAASQNKNEHFGLVHRGDAIGKTDLDFVSAQRAEAYRADDIRVMETGEPMINRMEAAPDAHGSPRLVLTSKVPLRDRSGRVIGIAGFSRPIDRLSEGSDPDGRLAKAIEHVHRSYGERLTSRKLAAMTGLSVSQFERRFRQAFGASPRQYIIRIRVEAAARALADTGLTVSEIAQQCGFTDHAHLSRCFRKQMQIAPTEYRSLHQPR